MIGRVRDRKCYFSFVLFSFLILYFSDFIYLFCLFCFKLANVVYYLGGGGANHHFAMREEVM